MLAVRWYVRYSLSYRDVEELLAERGIPADHVTLYRWVPAVHPGVDRRSRAEPARRRGSLVRGRDVPEGCWAVGVPVPGRAIDQHGQVIEVLARRSGIWRQPASSSPGHLTRRDGRPR
jgi:transposase, IS6 family